MYNLTIVTPEKIFFDGEVSSLVIPGSEGYLGVLTDHAPLITAVVPGKVLVIDKDKKEISMAVSFGFFEVSSNHATLLADSIEYSSDIDIERAREALERARQLARNEAGEIDTPRAQKAITRAKSRIRIARNRDDN